MNENVPTEEGESVELYDGATDADTARSQDGKQDVLTEDGEDD